MGVAGPAAAVRNAHVWVPPRPTESETLQVEPSTLHFHKSSRTHSRENHYFNPTFLLYRRGDWDPEKKGTPKPVDAGLVTTVCCFPIPPFQTGAPFFFFPPVLYFCFFSAKVSAMARGPGNRRGYALTKLRGWHDICSLWIGTEPLWGGST